VVFLVVVDLLHNPAGVTMLGHVVKKKKKKKKPHITKSFLPHP
jgi:UDP-N-acetylmuramyl tripeptide synthase